MRRHKQQIPTEEAKEILNNATSGVLSLVDTMNRPYGVPMSFVFDGDGAIYFHCATEGKKIDCIRNNPYSSFSVIAKDEIYPEKFTTYFKSVIAMGKISIISEKNDMIDILRLLSRKYSPSIDCEPEIAKGLGRVLILKLEIDTISGKEAIELTRARGNDNKND